ncbi:hypothetical protein BDV34DRAFT_193660 [Aspergillus parasiticus]|uniref:Uncharacterized protein n=1 Tax=Aspergillus parasiticus TaxID=5067 RepID=A0A5N6DNE5_ASPPA|nr:hypothetical protein BDV34DRAFT_193660 [Aspergillus parasiticus]
MQLLVGQEASSIRNRDVITSIALEDFELLIRLDDRLKKENGSLEYQSLSQLVSLTW